jgi:hypothetical protein
LKLGDEKNLGADFTSGSIRHSQAGTRLPKAASPPPWINASLPFRVLGSSRWPPRHRANR